MDPTAPPATPQPAPPPPGGAPGAAIGPGNSNTPIEAPMVTPQKAHGDEAMADVNVKMAMDVMTNLLPIYGVTSDKGKALMEVLNKMSKVFGVETSKHADAVPAEIAALVSSLQGGPGQPPPQPIVGGSPLPAPAVPGA